MSDPTRQLLPDPLAAPTERLRKLQVRIAGLILAGGSFLEMGEHWRDDVALVILSQPPIWEGFRDTELVARLRERHQPRSWGEGSDVVVCTCGHGAYDACEDAQLLAAIPPAAAA